MVWVKEFDSLLDLDKKEFLFLLSDCCLKLSNSIISLVSYLILSSIWNTSDSPLCMEEESSPSWFWIASQLSALYKHNVIVANLVCGKKRLSLFWFFDIYIWKEAFSCFVHWYIYIYIYICGSQFRIVREVLLLIGLILVLRFSDLLSLGFCAICIWYLWTFGSLVLYLW